MDDGTLLWLGWFEGDKLIEGPEVGDSSPNLELSDGEDEIDGLGVNASGPSLATSGPDSDGLKDGAEEGVHEGVSTSMRNRLPGGCCGNAHRPCLSVVVSSITSPVTPIICTVAPLNGTSPSTHGSNT